MVTTKSTFPAACASKVGKDPLTLTQQEITGLVQIACAAQGLDTMDKMVRVFGDIVTFFSVGGSAPEQEFGQNCGQYWPNNPTQYINCVNNHGGGDASK